MNEEKSSELCMLDGCGKYVGDFMETGTRFCCEEHKVLYWKERKVEAKGKKMSLEEWQEHFKNLSKNYKKEDL